MELTDILKQMKDDGVALPEQQAQQTAPVEDSASEALLKTDENDMFTVVDEILSDIKEENNLHLVYSALGGINPISGSETASVKDALVSQSVSKKYVSIQEESDGFSESELQVLANIIPQSVEGEKHIAINKALEGLRSEQSQLEMKLINLTFDIRKIEQEGAALSQWIRENAQKAHYAKLITQGKVLTPQMKAEMGVSDPHKFYEEYRIKEDDLRNIAMDGGKLNALQNEYDAIAQKHQEVTEQLKIRYIEVSNEIEIPLNNIINSLPDTISKISGIEFGKDIKDKKGDFYSFVKCECGVCTSFEMNHMPKVIMGDEFGDMESRVYNDRTIKTSGWNKGKSADGIPFKTSFRLRPDPNKYRRIVIQGLTNDNEGMVCSGCGKLMVPPVSVIEAMLEKGFLDDTITMCANKMFREGDFTFFGKGSGYSYPGNDMWGLVYDNSLYVPEITTEMTNVSSDFRIRDRDASSSVQNLTKREKMMIIKFMNADFDSLIDIKLIKEDILSLTKALRLTIRQIELKNQQINLEKLWDDPIKLNKAIEKNKRSALITSLITSVGFLDWAVVNRKSSLELTDLVNSNDTIIKALQQEVNEFELDNLIDSIIGSTLVREGEQWRVTIENVDTPHFRYVLVYQEQIKEFLRNIKNIEDPKVISIQNQFFENVRRYKGDANDNRKMEHVIKDFHRILHPFVGTKREEILVNAINTYGLDNLIYPDNTAPSWLVNEMSIVDPSVVFEPADPTTHERLYPNKAE